MDAKEFIQDTYGDIEDIEDAFIKNFQGKDMTYCEWVDIFIRWMEWSTKEDCEAFYG